MGRGWGVWRRPVGLFPTWESHVKRYTKNEILLKGTNHRPTLTSPIFNYVTSGPHSPSLPHSPVIPLHLTNVNYTTGRLDTNNQGQVPFLVCVKEMIHPFSLVSGTGDRSGLHGTLVWWLFSIEAGKEIICYFMMSHYFS